MCQSDGNSKNFNYKEFISDKNYIKITKSSSTFFNIK